MSLSETLFIKQNNRHKLNALLNKKRFWNFHIIECYYVGMKKDTKDNHSTAVFA